jgi:phage host-nuclease inhibitor protein Gam
VAIPGKLRGKLKPKKRVRFVITYASKANKPQCTKFGKKKTRNLTTRIVWVIPNA